jgi:hypothetical protein
MLNKRYGVDQVEVLEGTTINITTTTHPPTSATSTTTTSTTATAPVLRHQLWRAIPPTMVSGKVWDVVCLAAISALVKDGSSYAHINHH